MTLDPDARKFLDMAAEAGLPPLNTLPVADARAILGDLSTQMQPAAPPHHMQPLELEGPGGPIAARLYRPANADAAEALPVLIYLHGGGWVVGELEGWHAFCATVADRAGIAVIPVDYRLAPEHPFPAGLEDSLAAVRQVIDRAEELGIDPARLAIGGDSAGGNLAAAACLALRDQGGPALRAQVLIYPVTDLRMQTASYALPDGDGLLSGEMMHWFKDLYVGETADITDWRLSPLLAGSHADLPPAYVLTCEYDPLRDEGRAYAAALANAGVAVTHIPYPDQFHGFLMMGAAIPAAGPAINAIADYLHRHLTA